MWNLIIPEFKFMTEKYFKTTFWINVYGGKIITTKDIKKHYRLHNYFTFISKIDATSSGTI